jgi:chromosome segregation ATPase
MKIVWILALIAGLSAYWNFKLQRENAKEQRELRRAKDEENKLEHDLISARDQKQEQINEEKRILQDLDRDLKNKNHDLEALTDQLKGTNDVDLGGNNLSTQDWDIRHQKELVADLDRQLKDIRAQEKQYSNQTKNVQNQDKIARAESENALQAQITYQEQTLQQIQATLNQARADRASYEVTHKLQDQVNQQRAFVNNLKTQKATLSRNWTIASAQHNIDQTMPELQNSERDLTNRLITERDNLARLQADYNSNKTVANNHKGEVSKLQRDYQSKKIEIAGIQNQIAEHNRRLQALTAE